MRHRKLAWLAIAAGTCAAAAVTVRLLFPRAWLPGGVDLLLAMAAVLAAAAVVLGYAANKVSPAGPQRFGEDTYPMLFRLHPQPLFIVNHAGTRFLDVNEAALDLYGYARSEFLELTPTDIRPASDVERFLRHVQVVPPGLQRHGLWRHRRKDGGILLVEPVTHDMEYEGQLARIVLVNDVTGRYATEKALRVTGRTLEAVVDASPLAIIVVDEEERVQLWNEAAERMFGWVADEVIGGRNPLVVEPARAEWNRIRARVLAGETIAGMQVRRRRKDGTWMDLSLATAAVSGGKDEASWVIGIYMDITEQLRTEEKLRASEARYRELLEHASDGILLMDDTGQLLDANSTICEMLGYSRHEFRSMAAVDLLTHDSIAARPPRFPELRAGKTTVTQRSMRRKDGSRVAVEISSKKMSNGQIHAIVRDITERQRLEEQLRQSQKMEAVGRLAGGIAHDFNNILTAISGYTRMIAEEIAQDSRLADDLDQIITNTERASGLTSQLLAFSRKQVVQPQVLDVNAVIGDLGKLIRRLIGEDVELVTELAQELGRVRMDPGELEQVVMNLVVNARDAMPEGGVLRIATRNATLTGDPDEGCIIPVQPGPYVLLEVSDSGTGIDDALLSTIFEPFFTTKEPGKGTGLGLSTVYGIMEQAGGSVAVTSHVSGGTTFRVCIPRVNGHVEAPAGADRQRAAPVGGTETVLLVEDESAVRSLAARILKKHGYHVLEAADAAAAVDLLADVDDDIHLLLTDVIMPGASGRELAGRLRAHRPALRVLYMSGYMADEVGRAGVADDGAFLSKPFTPEALAAKVREVLDA